MFILKKREQLRRGAEKAREVRPRVYAASFGEYFVDGSRGNQYAVRIGQAEGGLAVDCTCLAGQNEKPCYHAAAALSIHQLLAATAPARDAQLDIIAHDLKFIARRAATLSSDFEIGDEIAMAVRSALQALREHELARQPQWLGEVA
jgi:uncharacterized Zn finger protein